MIDAYETSLTDLALIQVRAPRAGIHVVNLIVCLAGTVNETSGVTLLSNKQKWSKERLTLTG